MGTERRSAVCETVAVDGLDDAASGGEQADALVESGGPDPASGGVVSQFEIKLEPARRSANGSGFCASASAAVTRSSSEGVRAWPARPPAGRGPGRSAPAR